MYENYSWPLLASEWGSVMHYNYYYYYYNNYYYYKLRIIWMSMYLNTLLHSTHVVLVLVLQ